jgi:aspartyl-tRNA synthetase
MYRTHTCGELRISDKGKKVTLSGWIQRSRDLGGMTFIDLRDRYGLTQLVFNMETEAALCNEARKLGREFVIAVDGIVNERSNKNPKMPTGDIEITVSAIRVLNPANTPPFTIEDESDGGDELRMKYRYLDLRRGPLKSNLLLRHQMAFETRAYLNQNQFIEIETPVLIKSTPEGARDFVVPSRVNPGQFYALPQSPQTFKQLLMVAGLDRYMQIVKCFRDEDLRADRQPEFTQIDCEMSYVHQEDILNMFEGMIRHLFKTVKGIEFNEPFPRMSYNQAMEKYGNDKPDIRFGMEFVELTGVMKGKGFTVFDSAQYIGGIVASGCSEYTRKQIDDLTEFVKKPQIGAKGLIYIRYNTDGTVKSSIDKFYTPEELLNAAQKAGAVAGDLVLIMAGDKMPALKAMSELRLEMGNRLGLRKKGIFKPLWVLDFPLFEWDEETKRFYAMHHPFTSPKTEDAQYLESDPARVRANAYDCVINGAEVGGGSIRIHEELLQKRMFRALGFTEAEAERQFGFLTGAFRYGAPPHGGIAFGLDRLVSIFAGEDSIRDVIAFPKNNAARDVMADCPSEISDIQLKELSIRVQKS